LLCAEGQNRTGDTWFFSRLFGRFVGLRQKSQVTTNGSRRHALVLDTRFG